VNEKVYPIRHNSLIKKLSLQWDLRMGPYRAFFPQSNADIEACQKILPGSKADNRRFAACQDTTSGRIVAVLFIRDAFEIIDDSRQKAIFNLHRLDDDQLAQMAWFSDVHFTSSEDKNLISQVLLSHCFIEILKIGGIGILLDSDVGHFPLFKRMGMRPVGTLHQTSEHGYSIPMIFLPDKDYLSLINSPVLDLLRGVNFSRYADICAWYYQLLRDYSELQIGSAFYPESEADFASHHTITEGLSNEGREALLRNAMVFKCGPGEVLMTENDGGRSFGFIEKGVVKVVIGGKTVVLLSRGDIFGEIAFVMNSKRSAQVIAVSPDTEVVLLHPNAIEQIKDEKDRTTIWQNLARVLAQKVVLTNKLLQ